MRVLVTGAAGMLGSSVVRALSVRPDVEVVAPPRNALELTDRSAVAAFLAEHRPDAVVHAAARVAGIADKLAHPFDFLTDNVRLDGVVIEESARAGVSELMYLSSSVIYPRDAPQPLRPESLLCGPLEPANASYGLAKIVGTTACDYASQQFGVAYRAVAPSNMYGPGDAFEGDRAHLLAAAIHKIARAKHDGTREVHVWGDGTARRELTFAPDVADWLAGQVGSLDAWPAILNIGVGIDHSIREVYECAAEVMGFDGEFVFDPSRPAGIAARLLDSSEAAALGWSPKTSLRDGVTAVVADHRARYGY